MADSVNSGVNSIFGRVTANNGQSVVANARVSLTVSGTTNAQIPLTTLTDAKGRYYIECATGKYTVSCDAFSANFSESVSVQGATVYDVALGVQFGLGLSIYGEGSTRHNASHAVVGKPVLVSLQLGKNPASTIARVRWIIPSGATGTESEQEAELVFDRAGKTRVEAIISGVPDTSGLGTSLGSRKTDLVEADDTGKYFPPPEVQTTLDVVVSPPEIQTIRGNVGVTLNRSASSPTLDEGLWFAIRNRTQAISFERYRRFLNRVLQWEEGQSLPAPIEGRLRDLGAHLHGTAAYQLLKIATEIFLLMECGVRVDRKGRNELQLTSNELARNGSTTDELAEKLHQYLGHPPQLPYIRRVVEAAFPEYESSVASGNRLLIDKINEPCLVELIWSYWHAEGMLMQTMYAIARRFQNVRGGDRDPLLNLEIDPLRPANNLLWGYIQDEPNRLSVARLSAECAHEYGFQLYGKAVPRFQLADVRSKFLEAYNNLLYQSFVFFKEDAQTTVIADGYPLLNALKDVHLILAQGAGGGFGEVPLAARAEMLLVQFILARPEIREFLQSRIMVPYKEPWMPQVDAMKALQGWTDVTVTHFRDLGVYGEQLVLSVRYGDWTNVEDEDSAKNWARTFKEQIYAYGNAYRAVTGVDVTNSNGIDATVPAVFLQRRLAAQQRGDMTSR